MINARGGRAIGRVGVWCLAAAVVLGWAGRAWAGETTMVDSEGKTAWLYTPTDKPVEGKTYWLVVGVHGVGGDGKGACGAGYWAKAYDDVIVLGPTFGSARPASGPTSGPTTAPTSRPAGGGGGGFQNSYQMSGPAHVAKLDALIAEIGKTWKLHPKIVVHGFSAGGQFAHRFAMKYPERVAGVSAHSAGSWAKVEGNDRINPEAKGIPFVISCGEADKGTGGPAGSPTRIEGAKQFAATLKEIGFDVTLRTWPGVGHEFSKELMPYAKELMDKVRAGG